MFNLGNALMSIAEEAAALPSLVAVYAQGDTVASTSYGDLPAHLAGHLVVGLGVDNSGGVDVTADASFTQLFSLSHTNSAMQLAVGVKIAPTDNSSFGTWANAVRVGGGIVSGAAGVGTPVVWNTGGSSTSGAIPPLSGLDPRSAVLFGEIHSAAVGSISAHPDGAQVVVGTSTSALRPSCCLMPASAIIGGEFPGHTYTYGANCYSTGWAVEVFSL